MSADTTGAKESQKEIKRLCKLDKEDFSQRADEIRKIVAKPRFICTKCMRASRKKKYLCKPEKL